MALINCKECGAQISDKASACPKCGAVVNPGAQQSNYQVFNNVVTQPEKEVTPDQATYLSKWNWGAFLFGAIWSFFNGLVPVGVVMCLLAVIANTSSSLSAIGNITILLISIWLGVKGSKMAWNRKDWSSFDEFVETQKKWVKWGLIGFSIYLILVITIFVVAVSI